MSHRPALVIVEKPSGARTPTKTKLRSHDATRNVSTCTLPSFVDESSIRLLFEGLQSTLWKGFLEEG